MTVNQSNGRDEAAGRPAGSDQAAAGYRTPLRWRLAGIPLVVIIVLAMILLLPQHPTWEWIYPATAAAVCIAAGIGLHRTTKPGQAALLALLQLASGVGGLFLLAIPGKA